MSKREFGNLRIDPAENPAVLDTATWDEQAAWRQLRGVKEADWRALGRAIETGRPAPPLATIEAHTASAARYNGGVVFLARLPDAQQVLVSLDEAEAPVGLGSPFQSGTIETEGRTGSSDSGLRVAAYRTDAETLERLFHEVDGSRGPRALGSTPRLGIGCRMTTAIWPSIWGAMHRGGFASNAIQNSLRELNVLPDLLEGKPPKTNYQFSFGTIQEGHTGSTFEGLWNEGVLDALKSEHPLTYGADADHIMVKRSPDGVERAKHIIDSGRRYTFFTLDVGDILDYAALQAKGPEARAYLESHLPDQKSRREILDFHGRKRTIGGWEYGLSEETAGLLVGKYWRALEALGELTAHVRSLKGAVPFDLELSIDENPPEFATCDCLTGPDELVFLVLEAERRGIPLTHVAPNFGVEKGVDYRCPEGLGELETRMRQLCRIGEERDLMLDCHSGDDLSSRTRRVIGKATGGRIHFKVSPYLQVLFADVLHEMYPDRFRFWWDDALAWAGREAEAGSEFAIGCLKELESADDPSPSPHHAVFHHFNFATLGKRDEDGQFINRERFYTLPDDFYAEYSKRLEDYLCDVADDVFDRKK